MSCESQIEFFKNAISKNEEWAIKLLTSWLQFTSHPSAESLLKFGPFTACMNFHRDAIQGQHCFISYSSILSHEFDETSIEYEKYAGDSIERAAMIFKNGICLPASCSNEQIIHFLKDYLRETNLIVLNIFCQTNENLSFHLLDYLLLLILGLLLIIIGFSTFYDLKFKGKINNKIISSFSFAQNLKNLTKNDQNSIDCVNGLKVISAMWMIIGHRMDMMIEHPEQMESFMSLEERVILRMSQMYTVAVDTFFVISGLLVTQKCMKLFNDNKFCFLKFCLSRYVRFTSSLAIIFMFFMSSMPKMFVSGPQMKEYEEELEDCRKSWLESLLLLRNFNENLGSCCLQHTWYTSTDFQLFIISPAIIYGLFKFGQKFLKIIAFIILMGEINIFILKLSINSNDDNDEEEDDFYYETKYRFMPWLIGIMLSYIMQITEKNLSRQLRIIGWTSAFTSLIALEYCRIKKKSHLGEAIYESTHRVIWSLIIAWIIFACHSLKSGGFIRKILSSRYWRPLSKICLSIYLVHYLNVLLSVVNMKISYQFSIIWLLKIISIDIFMSLVFAFSFYMIIEAPVMSIMQNVIS